MDGRDENHNCRDQNFKNFDLVTYFNSSKFSFIIDQVLLRFILSRFHDLKRSNDLCTTTNAGYYFVKNGNELIYTIMILSLPIDLNRILESTKRKKTKICKESGKNICYRSSFPYQFAFAKELRITC